MVTFTLYLIYQDENKPRPIAQGCTKEQVLDILSRHLMLAEVDSFHIVPVEYELPFKEYTL